MAGATERIVVLVSAAQKRRIPDLAKASGFSTGEVLRRAAASFQPTQDDSIFEGMIEQIAKATARANAAIDDALSFVEASNKRIAALERAHNAGAFDI